MMLNLDKCTFTVQAENFLGSTPCTPSISMLARENPHWGVSGVPFIKRTTGAEEMAREMAVRTSVLRWRWRTRRAWRGRVVGGAVLEGDRAPSVARKACSG